MTKPLRKYKILHIPSGEFIFIIHDKNKSFSFCVLSEWISFWMPDKHPTVHYNQVKIKTFSKAEAQCILLNDRFYVHIEADLINTYISVLPDTDTYNWHTCRTHFEIVEVKNET